MEDLEVLQNNYCIYAHKNLINEKYYIGQTNQVPSRRWGVNGNNYKKQPKFWGAIQKYGWSNFEHIILEKNLTQEEANQKEEYYINLYDSYNQGYNATFGGKNRRLTDKEKEKISLFMKEKQLGANNSNCKQVYCLNTDQIFDTIAQAGEWCNRAPENISQACKRKSFSGKHPITQELLYWTFVKDSNFENNKIYFQNHKTELLNRKQHEIRQVQQINIETGEIINTFSNCTEAAEVVYSDKKKAKNISRCATGKQNKTFGYKWRYVNE